MANLQKLQTISINKATPYFDSHADFIVTLVRAAKSLQTMKIHGDIELFSLRIYRKLVNCRSSPLIIYLIPGVKDKLLEDFGEGYSPNKVMLKDIFLFFFIYSIYSFFIQTFIFFNQP